MASRVEGRARRDMTQGKRRSPLKHAHAGKATRPLTQSAEAAGANTNANGPSEREHEGAQRNG
jgi:hypothetical protein